LKEGETVEICNTTKLECSKCQPVCEHRKNIDFRLDECPFCGSIEANVYSESDNCYYVQCKCGICTVVRETEREVINIWNRRI
jgi:Lar family restriction alleviation protein